MAEADGAKILAWAKGKQFTMVGTGECFDLADQAIKDQGAKSADAYGEIKPDADYVWGTEIQVAAASPGDILQYKDYVCTITLDHSYTIDFGDGGGVDWGAIDESQSYKRPHHTAIVASGVKDSQISVIEQNVERGGGATKEKKVDMGSNYTTSPADVTTTADEQVTINPTWAQKAKGKSPSAETVKLIDGVLAKYNGKTFTAKRTTVKTVAVSGTIKAYRVQK